MSRIQSLSYLLRLNLRRRVTGSRLSYQCVKYLSTRVDSHTGTQTAEKSEVKHKDDWKGGKKKTDLNSFLNPDNLKTDSLLWKVIREKPHQQPKIDQSKSWESKIEQVKRQQEEARSKFASVLTMDTEAVTTKLEEGQSVIEGQRSEGQNFEEDRTASAMEENLRTKEDQEDLKEEQTQGLIEKVLQVNEEALKTKEEPQGLNEDQPKGIKAELLRMNEEKQDLKEKQLKALNEEVLQVNEEALKTKEEPQGLNEDQPKGIKAELLRMNEEKQDLKEEQLKALNEEVLQVNEEALKTKEEPQGLKEDQPKGIKAELLRMNEEKQDLKEEQLKALNEEVLQVNEEALKTKEEPQGLKEDQPKGIKAELLRMNEEKQDLKEEQLKALNEEVLQVKEDLQELKQEQLQGTKEAEALATKEEPQIEKPQISAEEAKITIEELGTGALPKQNTTTSTKQAPLGKTAINKGIMDDLKQLVGENDHKPQDAKERTKKKPLKSSPKDQKSKPQQLNRSDKQENKTNQQKIQQKSSSPFSFNAGKETQMSNKEFTLHLKTFDTLNGSVKGKIFALQQMWIAYSQSDKMVQPLLIKELKKSKSLSEFLQNLNSPESLSALDVKQQLKLYDAIDIIGKVNNMFEKSLIRCIRENLNQMQYSYLLRICSTESVNTEGTANLARKAQSEAIKRWTEIDSTKQLVTLITRCRNVDRKFCRNLEGKIMDYIHEMSVKELIAVFKFLAVHRERNMVILKAIAYHLSQKNDLVDSLHLVSDILYCCSCLSFTNVNLISTFCERLVQKDMLFSKPETPYWQTKMVESVFHSLASLRYLDESLLEKAMEFIKLHTSEFSNIQLANCIFSVASLGYFPKKHMDIVKDVCNSLIQTDLRSNQPLVWFRFVWSLCVLDLAEPVLVSSVLEEDFINSLISDKVHNQAIIEMLKNIDGYANHVFDFYKGHNLGLQFQDNEETKEELSKPELSDFQEVLVKMAPEGKFSKLNVKFPEGFTVDAVISINKGGKIQPFDGPDQEENISVAVKFLKFHDCTMTKGLPTGKILLLAQLLDSMDYQVILMPYTEWDPNLTVLKKVTLLQSRLNKAAAQAQAKSKPDEKL